MFKSAVLAAAAILGQVNPKMPDLYYDAKVGVSVQKPPKKEEWEFKSKGAKITNAQLSVAHRVEDLAIDILVQDSPANAGGTKNFDSNDAKGAAEQTWTNQSSDANFSDAKKKKLEETPLPGNGAGGVKTWFLEATLKDKADKVHEMRVWCFIGKENRSLYRVFMFTPEGVYEKNKKEIEYVLSTIRCYKVKK